MGDPERVVVQHILVSFTGRLPDQKVRRSEDEARRLAYEILERATGGEDFDALVKEYTDDRHPGIYALANRGIPLRGGGEFKRDDMVPGFGDASFDLAPGEIAICEYDRLISPFGYHIIKRLE